MVWGRGFLTSSSANKRNYQKVYSSNVTSKQVPRACALVKSGPKKGKLRKGCYIARGGHAFCDKVVAEKLSCDATTGKNMGRKRKAKRSRAKQPPTLVAKRRKRRSPARVNRGQAKQLTSGNRGGFPAFASSRGSRYTRVDRGSAKSIKSVRARRKR